MILAIVFAELWAVCQLIVLGTFARTIRVRTVLMAVAVGLYACAPLAVLLQVTWISAAAWLSGTSAYQLVRVAAYTADPVEGAQFMELDLQNRTKGTDEHA